METNLSYKREENQKKIEFLLMQHMITSSAIY